MTTDARRRPQGWRIKHRMGRNHIKVYDKDYNSTRIRGKHIAPHTVEMASMWAVMTRLEQPKKANLTVLQKLKLYDGKTLPGYTEDSVKELQKEADSGSDPQVKQFAQQQLPVLKKHLQMAQARDVLEVRVLYRHVK